MSLPVSILFGFLCSPICSHFFSSVLAEAHVLKGLGLGLPGRLPLSEFLPCLFPFSSSPIESVSKQEEHGSDLSSVPRFPAVVNPESFRPHFLLPPPYTRSVTLSHEDRFSPRFDLPFLFLISHPPSAPDIVETSCFTFFPLSFSFFPPCGIRP